MRKLINRKTVSVGVGAVCAAAGALALAGPASAATGAAAATRAAAPVTSTRPASRQVQGFSNQWFQLTNRTPFTMTLVKEETSPLVWGLEPDRLIGPGGTVHWNIPEIMGLPGSPTTVQYQFTDLAGVPHVVEQDAPEVGGMASYSDDFDVNGNLIASTSFHMQMDADGDWAHADAVLNSPAVVTIDGSTDPGAAAAVMAQWDTATGKSFTLKDGTGDPSYSYLPQERASSMLFNNTDSPATQTLHTGVSHTETTSVTGTVGWKTSLGFMDFANAEINASIAVGHEWTTTNDWGEDEIETVQPGHVGWFDQVVSEETVHGDFSFTSAVGIVYHVTNFTLTQPDQSLSGNAGLAINFSAEERAMTPTEQQQYPAGTMGTGNPVH